MYLLSAFQEFNLLKLQPHGSTLLCRGGVKSFTVEAHFVRLSSVKLG